MMMIWVYKLGIFDANDDDIGDKIENLVNKFKASLKNKARRWYQNFNITRP